MWPSGAGVRVYVAAGATDMRKSIDSLGVLVATSLELDPLSGHLFVFRNRRGNQVKILYWDRNGFCLWHKRLERGRFGWPNDEAIRLLDWRQLTWLLKGLDIRQGRALESLPYTEVY